MKRIMLLFSIVITGGAASDTGLGREKYKLPTDVGATATARFPKGNLHLSIRFGDTQYYGVLRGDTCKTAQKLTIYDAGIGGNTTEKSFTIEAGHKLRILATLQKGIYRGDPFDSLLHGLPLIVGQLTCTRIVEFIPEAGKTYLITQEAGTSSPEVCSIGVKEEDSGSMLGVVTNDPSLSCHF